MLTRNVKQKKDVEAFRKWPQSPGSNSVSAAMSKVDDSAEFGIKNSHSYILLHTLNLLVSTEINDQLQSSHNRVLTADSRDKLWFSFSDLVSQ